MLSCTTALFLSGYAIQQRTVRHLRAAIRPDTLSPQIYLPDRFRDDTTELADGTIVMLDEYDRPVRLKSGRISLGKAPEAAAAAGADVASGEGQDGEAIVIEVQETLPEVLGDAGQEQQKVMVEDEELPEMAQEPSERHDVPEEREQEQTPAPPPPPTEEESAKVQARPQAAPWEVRHEDMPQERPAEKPEEEEEQKPISRAERRRLIKEEIQRLSQGDEPLYYQRRLW